MNQRYFKLFCAVLVLAAASLACQLAFSTANVDNLRIAQDEAGQQTTTQFDPEDTFYQVGDLSNAPDDTKLKAVWTHQGWMEWCVPGRRPACCRRRSPNRSAW